MAINIVKYENGNTAITNADGKYANITFSSNARVRYTDLGVFEIWDGGVIAYSFKFAQVAATQIMPASPEAPTDAATLLDLLNTYFFFELSGGATTEQLETLIENFCDGVNGTVLPVQFASSGGVTQDANGSTDEQNLDGTTTAYRIGVNYISVDGNIDDVASLKSTRPNFIFSTDSAFAHSWDLAFSGAAVNFATNKVFEGVGYSADPARPRIEDGVYIRKPYSNEATQDYKLCVSVGGVEEFIQSTGILHATGWGRFYHNWNGATDVLTAKIFDGSQTVTVLIENFSVDYPTLINVELYKVVTIGCGSTIGTVTTHRIDYDRHTEYIKSNY